jgi:hypothetical protein
VVGPGRARAGTPSRQPAAHPADEDLSAGTPVWRPALPSCDCGIARVRGWWGSGPKGRVNGASSGGLKAPAPSGIAIGKAAAMRVVSGLSLGRAAGLSCGVSKVRCDCRAAEKQVLRLR